MPLASIIAVSATSIFEVVLTRVLTDAGTHRALAHAGTRGRTSGPGAGVPARGGLGACWPARTCRGCPGGC